MKKILIFNTLLLLSLPVFAQYEIIYDSTFSGDGIWKSSFTIDETQGALLQSDGKLLVFAADYLANQYENFTLMRFLPNGEPDLSFNQTGKLTWNRPYHYYYSHAAFQLDNDNIIIPSAGYTQGDTALVYRYMMTAIHPGGSLDSTFGHNGVFAIEPVDSSNYFIAYNFRKTDDNKVLIAGAVEYGEWPDISKKMVFLRVLPNGVIDSTYGTNGFRSVNLPQFLNISNLIPDPVEQEAYYLTHAAYYLDSTVSGIIKIHPDLSLEELFYWEDSLVVSGAQLLPNGKWYLSKTIPNDYNELKVVINADGTLDNTFSRDGIFQEYGGFPSLFDSYGLKPTDDGKFLVHFGGFTVGRLNANGTVDYSFDLDGQVKRPDPTEFYWDCRSTSMIEQPDGKIILAGRAKNKMYIIRLKERE